MKNSVFIFLLIISKLSTSQNATVAYSRDFEFKEGIYLTIDQFKQNNPIPISDIVSAVPKTEHNFLTQVLDQKTVTFKDETGQEQKLATASIWGYCRNRSVFLNFNQTFNRLLPVDTDTENGHPVIQDTHNQTADDRAHDGADPA